MGQPLASEQRALIDALTRANWAALAGLGVGVLLAPVEGVGVTTAGARALGEVSAAVFGPPPAPEEMILPRDRPTTNTRTRTAAAMSAIIRGPTVPWPSSGRDALGFGLGGVGGVSGSGTARTTSVPRCRCPQRGQ
jgi:hypothetical protein